MTERSMFWADGVGDGGPYTHDELRLLYKALVGSEDADRGVLVTQGNELAPSSTGANNIQMATGRGVVDGTLYGNDAILDIVTASPTGTTGRRLVLQKDWAARTVRAVIISSADNDPAIPALTQADGTIWEIPIASFTIAAGGAIGVLTDQRRFCEGTDSRAITILDRDYGQVEVVSDATEQSIYSFSIPARALGADGGVRLTIGGDYLNDTGSSRTLVLRIKLGATTILATTQLNAPNSGDRRKWQLVILLTNVTVTSQKCSATLTLSDIQAADFPVTATPLSGAGYNSASEDTTVALTLDITAQHAVAHASLSLRKEHACLELLPAA